MLNTPPAVPSPMRPTWRSASPMAVRAVPTESPAAVRAVPTESPAAGPAGPTQSPQPTLRAAEEAVRPLASWPAPSCTVVAEEEDDDPFLLDSAADVTLVAPYLVCLCLGFSARVKCHFCVEVEWSDPNLSRQSQSPNTFVWGAVLQCFSQSTDTSAVRVLSTKIHQKSECEVNPTE